MQMVQRRVCVTGTLGAGEVVGGGGVCRGRERQQ